MTTGMAMGKLSMTRLPDTGKDFESMSLYILLVGREMVSFVFENHLVTVQESSSLHDVIKK